MKHYYVNLSPHANGYYEVHELSCGYIPPTHERLYLGFLSSCYEAVKEATKQYANVNCCTFCCTSCDVN